MDQIAIAGLAVELVTLRPAGVSLHAYAVELVTLALDTVRVNGLAVELVTLAAPETDRLALAGFAVELVTLAVEQEPDPDDPQSSRRGWLSVDWPPGWARGGWL